MVEVGGHRGARTYFLSWHISECAPGIEHKGFHTPFPNDHEVADLCGGVPTSLIGSGSGRGPRNSNGARVMPTFRLPIDPRVIRFVEE